jgi:hypothetical protein
MLNMMSSLKNSTVANRYAVEDWRIALRARLKYHRDLAQRQRLHQLLAPARNQTSRPLRDPRNAPDTSRPARSRLLTLPVLAVLAAASFATVLFLLTTGCPGDGGSAENYPLADARDLERQSAQGGTRSQLAR